MIFADIRSLKGVEKAVCGTKNIDLTKESIKTTTNWFCCDEAIQHKIKSRKLPDLTTVN